MPVNDQTKWDMDRQWSSMIFERKWILADTKVQMNLEDMLR